MCIHRPASDNEQQQKNIDNYNSLRYFHTDNVAWWESHKWIRDLGNSVVVVFFSFSTFETKQKHNLSGFDQKYNLNALSVLWSMANPMENHANTPEKD